MCVIISINEFVSKFCKKMTNFKYKIVTSSIPHLVEHGFSIWKIHRFNLFDLIVLAFKGWGRLLFLFVFWFVVMDSIRGDVLRVIDTSISRKNWLCKCNRPVINWYKLRLLLYLCFFSICLHNWTIMKNLCFVLVNFILFFLCKLLAYVKVSGHDFFNIIMHNSL